MEDYVQDKVTGLLVDGTPESYVQAIRWILDPQNEEEVKGIGNSARKSVAEQYTLANYVDGVKAVIDEIGESRASVSDVLRTPSGRLGR